MSDLFSPSLSLSFPFSFSQTALSTFLITESAIPIIKRIQEKRKKGENKNIDMRNESILKPKPTSANSNKCIGGKNLRTNQPRIDTEFKSLALDLLSSVQASQCWKLSLGTACHSTTFFLKLSTARAAPNNQWRFLLLLNHFHWILLLSWNHVINPFFLSKPVAIRGGSY